MKKLLILGANSETIPLVQEAVKTGIEVHVADPDLSAPAKEYADIRVDIDASDTEKLFEYAVKAKIDGVMVGVADRLILPYAQLCEKLGLPCYCNVQQAQIWSNKGLFNKLIEQSGLSVIPSVKYDNSQKNLSSSVSFPVLVKPVDSNAGKGMSVVHQKEFLPRAILHAMQHSSEGEILIEKYMECDDVIIYYSLLSGNLKLIASADKFTLMSGSSSSKVGFAHRYPSKYQMVIKGDYEKRLGQICQDTGLKNGVMLLSAFVDEGQFYFYDPGLRLQGEAPDIHVQNETGINHRSSLISLALNENIKTFHKEKDVLIYSEGSVGYTLWILLKPGKISMISGMEILEDHPSVFKINTRFKVDDIVTSNFVGTEAQVFARVYIKVSMSRQLIEIINILKEKIKILDAQGHNMVVDAPYHKLLS